jgi:hypothetical protein
VNLKPDITTYLLTLITIFVGWLLNLLSTRLAHRKTQELEKRKMLQAKIEEFACLVDEIEKAYRKVWSAVAVSVSSKKPLELSPLDIPFARARILIDFYFPQIGQTYEILMKERKDFGDKIFPTVNEQDEKKQAKLFMDLTETHKRVEVACGKLCALAAEIAQKNLM